MSKTPTMFVGHGSPMNAIEDNDFTQTWRHIANTIEKPKAILSVSAHWYTDGSRVNNSEKPRTIYDMYGFPKELYRVKYDCLGSPDLAEFTRSMITREVKVDNSWGCDHGTWSVLCRMYPQADIPVFQLSVDKNATAEEHFQIGQEIGKLREKGIMIMGSGNVVHNLAVLAWQMTGGQKWAMEFDDYVKDNIVNDCFGKVINYSQAGDSARFSFVTPDHFYPLLYVLGSVCATDKLSIFNNSCIMGSLSMTSYMFE